MGPPKLTFYFDLVSPFAYLSWYFIRVIPSREVKIRPEPILINARQTNAAFRQCEITFVPAWLAGIMRETDNKPPLAIKST